MAYVNCNTKKQSLKVDIMEIKDETLFYSNRMNVINGMFNCDLDITFYPRFGVVGYSSCAESCEHYEQKVY